MSFFYGIRQKKKNSSMPISAWMKKKIKKKKSKERDLHANRRNFPPPNIDPPNLCKKLFFEKKYDISLAYHKKAYICRMLISRKLLRLLL